MEATSLPTSHPSALSGTEKCCLSLLQSDSRAGIGTPRQRRRKKNTKLRFPRACPHCDMSSFVWSYWNQDAAIFIFQGIPWFYFYTISYDYNNKVDFWPSNLVSWWGKGKYGINSSITFCSLKKKYLFIFGCVGSLLLRGLFSNCGKWGLLFIAVHEFLMLIVVASVAAEQGLSSCGSWALEHRLSSCGTWA